MNEENVINTKDYPWMRNDFELDNPLTVGDIEYPSVEHAYQAAKTDDNTIKLLISNSSVWRAREIGADVDIAFDWDSKRYFVMLQLLRLKFTANKDLAKRLVDTGDVTIEMLNAKDKYWGCVVEDSPLNGESQKVGDNLLGKILMDLRSEFKFTLDYNPEKIEVEEEDDSDEEPDFRDVIFDSIDCWDDEVLDSLADLFKSVEEVGEHLSSVDDDPCVNLFESHEKFVELGKALMEVAQNAKSEISSARDE